MTTTRKASSTLGTDRLREILEVLKAYGVTRYREAELELELAPQMPQRALEDFATTGLEAIATDDDGRFDHVAMRPRKFDEEMGE